MPLPAGILAALGPAIKTAGLASAKAAGGGLASSMLGNIGGGLLSNLFGRANTKRQMRDMIKFWRMQNEYNHPSAQMARLQEAGLNPHLIYGDSAAGATGTAGDIGQAPKNPDPEIGKYFSDMVGSAQRSAQTSNLRAQNTVLQNEGLLKAAQAAKTLSEAGIAKNQLKKLVQTMESQISRIQSEAQTKGYEASLKAQEYETKALSPNQRRILRGEFYQSMLRKYDRERVDLSNASKLNDLREIEAKLKEAQYDLYTTKAIVGMFAQIMGIR